jgi:ergothioneine biosynthesis protein EgtB
MMTVGKHAMKTLAQHYASIRAFTEALAEPLAVEDQVVQSMPDASPTKWHRAHTTWFFETFVLAAEPGFAPFDPRFGFLFNSYYEAIGPRHARAARGVLSRPTVLEVTKYRAHVDAQMTALLARGDAALPRALRRRVVLGLHHEQQHQELLLADIQNAFAQNPLRPQYARTRAHEEAVAIDTTRASEVTWVSYEEGLRHIGHEGAFENDSFESFAFDNEGPSHRVFVNAFELASRAVTADEFMAFIESGGYARPELWLADGWAARCAGNWTAPLYWEQKHSNFGAWQRFSMHGVIPVAATEPVCHVSYFEADAFARWTGARLPTEAEWEVAGNLASREDTMSKGAFVDDRAFAPRGSANLTAAPARLHGLLGDVWEWTSSAYSPYPGYVAEEGALGEYNGKFMCSQMVLRGGSSFTPQSHIRMTYRNFFPPEVRWQMAGFRLARSR